MLAIRVLGELELELGGQRLDPPTRQSGRLLLGYLALAPGVHARADLAALLWPNILESSARASLRSAIAAVRRALGDDSDRYLISSAEALGLAGASQGVLVDHEQFEALVDEGRLHAALELCRGPLLQGLDAEWVRLARTEHVDRLSDVLGRLAREAEDAGSLEQAIRYTRRQVALSPLAEPPNRELMRRLAAAGDRASALIVYGDLADRFRRELQTVPSLATREAAEQARKGVAATRSTPIPLAASLETLLSEPFVGRRAELEILRRAFDRATGGEFQAVLLSGEPGIGKTALLAQLAAAALPDATVLLGPCRRPPSGPLEPFVEALRHYAANVPAEQLHPLPHAGELAALVPDLGETSASPPADLLPDGHRIARALVETFAALSRDRPLVLLVDDLHDADRATAEVAAQLLAAPKTSRLLVVLSFRDTDLARSPLVQRIASNVRALSGSSEISLSGLDEEGVALLARTLRQDEVPTDDVRRLHSRTGGNPFFVTHLMASGDPFADSPLPQRIHDLIWQEVERLGPDAHACLSVASAAGGEFDLSTVAAVAGYDDDRALDALDDAVLARVLVELPSGVGRYQFRHDLLRESVYERLTATRRAYLHHRLADVLTARRAAGQSQSLIPIVEHLREARDLVSPDELAEQLLQAAEEAEQQGTFAQAADFYSEFIDLIGDRSDERRARTLTALGDVARRAGQFDRARSAFVQAHALASELEDEQLQVAATVGLCALPFVPGDRPVDPEMIAMLEGALDLSASREPGVRSQLLARLALEAFYDPARPRPDSLAEEAVAVAERSEDPRALAAALAVGHLAFRGPDGSERRLELARRLAARAGAASQHELVVSALLGQTVAEVERGELDALEAGARKVIELARALRQPAYTWWAYLWKATKAIAAGDVAEGEALSRRAYEIGEVTFGSSAELELQAQRAWIALEQDRFVELRKALNGAEAAFAALPVWQSLKARVLVATGAEDLAAQSVAELTGRGLATLERDTNWLISATLLAETAAQAGDTTTAEELFRRLRPRAQHWAVSARGTVCLGPVAAALSLLGTVLGDVDEAERFYAVAHERCLASGAESAARRLERQYRARVSR